MSQCSYAPLLRPAAKLCSLWVRSHADLPLKTYQIVNTFRYETKQTRSFIRVREIHFFEAHTAHIDEEDATRQIEEDLEIVANIMNDLGLPYIASRRPVWDTFPGAWYTIGIDVIMPNGRTLQVASCHHYRDQWAQAFDLTYEAEDRTTKHCHQTTYGMSDTLGAVVGMHGDDAGLIMPPSMAPIQVVLIPVAAHKTEAVMETIHEVNNRLKAIGIRTHVDNRDIRPGQKQLTMTGKSRVPLRLDIGPRDVENGNAFAARRTGGKHPLPISDIESSVRSELTEIQPRCSH